MFGSVERERGEEKVRREGRGGEGRGGEGKREGWGGGMGCLDVLKIT